MPALEARVPEPVPTSGPLPAKIFAGWNKNTVPPYASLPEGGAVTTAMTTLDGMKKCFYVLSRFGPMERSLLNFFFFFFFFFFLKGHC